MLYIESGAGVIKKIYKLNKFLLFKFLKLYTLNFLSRLDFHIKMTHFLRMVIFKKLYIYLKLTFYHLK